jgi:tetrahydromethanopterin S-methyltransferase subunit C
MFNQQQERKVMGFDRKYLVWALGYVALGMGLGIFMAASHNHAQHVTHAHILLVGFVVSLIYAVIHKLWLGEKPPRLAKLQFIAHQVGAVTMFGGLFLLFGNIVPETQLDPVLATASIAVFSAALLMIFMVYKANAVKT